MSEVANSSRAAKASDSPSRENSPQALRTANVRVRNSTLSALSQFCEAGMNKNLDYVPETDCFIYTSLGRRFMSRFSCLASQRTCSPSSHEASYHWRTFPPAGSGPSCYLPPHHYRRWAMMIALPNRRPCLKSSANAYLSTLDCFFSYSFS